MQAPQKIAENILGHVRWDSPTHGFCRCPGQAQHTQRTQPRHCEVHIDGAPTIHCFHSSCRPAIEAANKHLRRALSTRKRIGQDSTAAPASGQAQAAVPPVLCDLAARQRDRERLITEHIRLHGAALLEEMSWPYNEILASSPVNVAGLSPREQFDAWTRLWPEGSIVWIGDVTHSGRPSHACHFKPIEEWRASGPAGKYTCSSSFKPGTCSRSDANVLARHWLVVESDTLSKDQIGAVFLYVRRRLGYDLHCIVDTAGKSLHAWFSPPPAALEPNLKTGLVALGCDPKMFGRAQPCRVPGVLREGKVQRLIWLRA